MKRIQKKGWSVGENTKTRKTSINLDTDIAKVIEEKRKSKELQLSQNRLTEICLQRYLPEMQWN